MRKIKVKPRTLGFVIGTRAALFAGIGLLVSGKLPSKARRALGASLVALGAITTIPAVRALRAAT